MTTSPQLSDTEIEVRIAGIAATQTMQLTAADTAWIAGSVRRWLSNYAFNEKSLTDVITSWVQGCAALVDMDGQAITIGTTLLVPFAKGGSGGGAYMRRMVVIAITEPAHRGYGYYTRALSVQGLDDGRKMRHNYPKNCLVLVPAALAAS
jgi:hypothetical protein